MIIERKNEALSFWKMTFLLCCVLTSVSFISLKAAAEDFDESCYRLPVFQTSDIHGHLAYIDGETPEYRLAYISDKVKDVRGYGDNARKDKALLLDAGDIYQGYPMSALNHGQPMSKAFTIMGYDAVAVGNHEFDWGLDTVVDFDDTMFDIKDGAYAVENPIPVVTSNLYKNGEKAKLTNDYVILKKTAVDGDGKEMPVRIAVIGFAGNYADDIAFNKFTGAGYTINMDFKELNDLASKLESDRECDATIVLAHEDPKTIAEGLGEGSVVDLVLGGHVHNNTEGITSWGLPYLEPTNQAKAYTYSELVFEKGSDTAATFKGVDEKTAACVPVDPGKTYKPENWEDLEKQQDQDNQCDLDPELVKLSDYCIDHVGQLLAKKLGYITETAMRGEFRPENGVRASGAGNFVAWLYARMVGAQVGFVNHGGLRADFVLEEGKDHRDILVNDIYTLFPFDNKIYCFEITYEDLLQVFQYAVSTGGAKLLSHMVGVDCYYTGKTVNAIISPDGKKAYANGKWFDGWKDQKIRVALSEYMATKNRKEEGDPDNPFCTWLNTDRLISNDTIDAEGALRVLRSEAGENDGLLKTDSHTYYINEEYPDDKTPETDPTSSPTPGPAADPGTTPSVTPAPSKTRTPAAQINTGFKVKPKGRKVTVTWGKVSGASFYKVYAAYGNSKKYKLVKKVKAGKKRTLVIKKINGKKINKKKKIKIYVAAYKTTKGKSKKIATSKSAKITSWKKVKYGKAKSI